MEAWLSRAVDLEYIKEVSIQALQHGVQCAASENSWYDGGVVFDWSQLHSRLAVAASSTQTPSTSPSTRSSAPNNGLSVATEADSLFAYVRKLSGGDAPWSSADFLMITVIEVSQPWELQPLSEQAQSWSVFSAAHTADPSADGLAAQRLYTFLRGPPGQKSARDDILLVLQSVTDQLRAKKIHVVSFLSSFVLVGNDFTTLLHETAAVHKALKEAGLTIHGAASSFGPRRVLPSSDQHWSTLPLESLTSEADIALFTTDLFFQWLQDSYTWRCLRPIKVFADDDTPEKALNAKRVRLFERFVRQLLLPRAAQIGFQALKSTLPEEGGDLLELSEAHLACKRTLVGPQKWSILDLRLTLCQMDAYAHDPLVVLS